jgi:hypothetical protein
LVISSSILISDYRLDEIFGFNESSFNTDAPGCFTLEKKRAPAQTSGKEKVRLSCLMTTTASRKTFPVLCIVTRKKKIECISHPDSELVIYDTNGISIFLSIPIYYYHFYFFEGTFNTSNLVEAYVERIFETVSFIK